MAKITVITHAYNPGKYIYPCVDSVLGQTFREFKYVIVDNASSDGTKEVLEAYAEKDDRICLYRNEDNSGSTIPSIENYADTKYFMILDHDDYLEPKALELLYEMAEEGELDMVFGRCVMMNAKGESLEEAGYSQSIPCITKELLYELFCRLHWQMRTVWGKLIRTDLFAYADRETYDICAKSRYGADTAMILSMAFAAERLGNVGEVLHHYRILERSESRIYNRCRFESDYTLLEQGKRLLREHGALTVENELFLYKVYYNAILDTFRLAVASDCTLQEKCEIIKEIITKEQTIDLYAILTDTRAEEERKKFVQIYGKTIVEYFVGQPLDETLALVMSWLRLLFGEKSVSNVELIKLWEKDKSAFVYLCVGQNGDAYRQITEGEYKNEFPELLFALAPEQETDVKKLTKVLCLAGLERQDLYETIQPLMFALAQQNTLLKLLSEETVRQHSSVVTAVCCEEYYLAINLCLEQLDDTEKINIEILELAINLAAVLGEADAFVTLKKMHCKCLLKMSKQSEAATILADLEEMCPNDIEVQEMRKYLEEA